MVLVVEWVRQQPPMRWSVGSSRPWGWRGFSTLGEPGPSITQRASYEVMSSYHSYLTNHIYDYTQICPEKGYPT